MKQFLKGKVCLVTAALSMALAGVPAGVSTASEQNITLVVDGRILSAEQGPIEEGHQILVPLRDVAEALGATVTWNNETSSATVAKADTSLTVSIGATAAEKDGKAIQLQTAPKLVKGKTLISGKELSGFFAKTYRHYSDTHAVSIEDALRTPDLAASAVIPAGAPAEVASFVDPTAALENPAAIQLGERDYIAPYAAIKASNKAPVRIGDLSDLQDNTVINASYSPVTLGKMAIMGHGAQLVTSQVDRPALLAADTDKPEYTNPGVDAISNYIEKHEEELEWGGIPAFMGFNSIVDGSIVSDGSMVNHLAKVNPGIVIKTGIKVLPGKLVASQEEADHPELGKVAYLTEADLDFMMGVVDVNISLAKGYTELYNENTKNVSGINYDPGTVKDNMERDLPTVAGKPTVLTDTGAKSFRIIGDVNIADISSVGNKVSLRADEGPHFKVGENNQFLGANTFHALEGTDISVGNNVSFAVGAIVHGGPDSHLAEGKITEIGDDTSVGEGALVFKSVLGKQVVVGAHSIVMGSNIPDQTTIPNGEVWSNNKKQYDVEW